MVKFELVMTFCVDVFVTPKILQNPQNVTSLDNTSDL